MNFDSVASIYRTLETMAFGHALQRARVRWLGNLSDCRRAVVLGEGNGRFLVELLRSQPLLQVECIDASARMLKTARRRVEQQLPDALPRVRFREGDIGNIEINLAGCDLIVTLFVLDCFNEEALRNVVPKLAAAAAPSASWLYADFCLPGQGIRRLKAKLWLKAMYLFFRFAAGLRTQKLVDPTPFIHGHGFLLRDEALTRGGMVTSQLWVRGTEPASALVSSAGFGVPPK